MTMSRAPRVLGKVTRNCKQCNSEFMCFNNQPTKFCGRTCYYKYRSIVYVKENHPQWKDASALTYSGIHRWVYRTLGQPSICDDCGNALQSRLMHWANISNEYKRDISDWKRLCVYCHRKFDKEHYLKVNKT